MIRSLAVCATVLLLTVAADAASSQTPPSSAYALFGRSTSKQAISKACSDQANAKGLHGKARKSFRAKCKRHGGKPT
jgi:psiF repeat